MKTLRDKNIATTSTVGFNRTNNCPLKSDKMKKEDRGAYDYRFDAEDEIFATIYKDNNCVKMLSNHQGLEPLEKASCWSRAENKNVKIPMPQCIHCYNKFMGCVDKLNWFINKYRIRIRSKK